MALSLAKPVADPLATSGRYERKLLVTGISRANIEHILRLHPAQFSEIYTQRYVNNCYFDTPDLRLLWDAVQGHSHRLKVRVRWYGDLFGPLARPVLELKRKRGLVGTKESVALSPLAFDADADLGTLDHWLGAVEAPASIMGMAGALRPALVNRYSRRYFQSADRRFRLTIDSECEYYSAEAPRHRACRLVVDDITTIVEVKYAVDHDTEAEFITSAFPFLITKSSKYVTGMQRLGYR